MRASTHFLGGIIAGYTVYPSITGAAIGGVAGLLPDIDDNRSFAGRVFFFISWPLRHIVGHRTLFHSWIPILLLVICAMVWQGGVTLAFLAGFSSHILLDMLVGRVQFFFPAELKIGIKMPYAFYVVVDLIIRVGLAAIVLVFLWNTYLAGWGALVKNIT